MITLYTSLHWLLCEVAALPPSGRPMADGSNFIIDKSATNNIFKTDQILMVRCLMPDLRSVSCDAAYENSVDPRFHERRRTPRMPLYGGSFAVLHTEGEAGDNEVLAQILDINCQGIALRFFAGESRGDQVRKIDITLPNQDFSLQGLPVQAVNETDDHTHGNHCNSKVRRLGMCFDQMSDHKSQALDTFIERFACGRPD
jgi:hypothetical protein